MSLTVIGVPKDRFSTQWTPHQKLTRAGKQCIDKESENECLLVFPRLIVHDRCNNMMKIFAYAAPSGVAY